WSKAFILDHTNLPQMKCGGSWTKSRIEDEDLREELLTPLQSLGKYVSAFAIVDYLKWLNVMWHYQLSKSILLSTTEHWMKRCGFCWTLA
ncbi:hypothetical protein BS17DRAFT_704451, partial [Gyrodon lividus]